MKVVIVVVVVCSHGDDGGNDGYCWKCWWFVGDDSRRCIHNYYVEGCSLFC